MYYIVLCSKSIHGSARGETKKKTRTMSGLTLLKKILTKKATIQDNKDPSIKQGEKDRNNDGTNQLKQ
jgi:hypothetical protein